MEKMKFTDNQRAFEYALYMIAASYFEKSICKSKLTEKNMLLHFKEQKLDKQYQMEEICIKFMEELVKKIPYDLFNRNMDVKLNRLASGLTEIIFLDKEKAISFQGKYAGGKSKIHYQVWTKKKQNRNKRIV